MSDAHVEDVIQYSERVLEKLHVGQVRYFPESVFLNARWDLVYRDIKTMRVEMNSYVLADHLADDSYSRTEVFKAPTSPWQFFKQRHAESWWLRWLVQRRPVVTDRHEVTVTVDVARYLGYPQAPSMSQTWGPPVIMEHVRVNKSVAAR